MKLQGIGELDCSSEFVSGSKESSVPDIRPPSLNRIHGAFMMLIVKRSARFGVVLYPCPTGGHDQLAYQPHVAELRKHQCVGPDLFIGTSLTHYATSAFRLHNGMTK